MALMNGKFPRSSIAGGAAAARFPRIVHQICQLISVIKYSISTGWKAVKLNKIHKMHHLNTHNSLPWMESTPHAQEN